VSKIVTELLEEQMRKALVGLAVAWGEVKGEVGSRQEKREQSNEGLMADYVEVGVKKVVALFREEDEEVETHTRVTTKGLVHTSTPADVDHDQGTSDEHDREQQEEETAVAIGAGAQLFPDKAGAYGENDARPSVADVVVGEVVDGAKVVADETLEVIDSVAEVREEVERAERRRKKRVRFEEICSGDDYGGWRSAVFNL
jgi:hypothetical protein